ncbi:protein Niban 1 [Hemicordylus capensis]|uniref:protein Niban 1 n=1 Tax=Hemicordylus capensis TaxID=884348 RepID=UPI002302C8B6|nr:protein Niban 1 [Hemicordylus capensis]
MGGSGSSLLDESKCTYIRGKTEAVIKNFSPHYKRQYAVSFCQHIQNELEQNRDLQSQFLKTKPPAESSMVFFEGEVSHFAEDLKKWKDRCIVIKHNYAVESFESKEAFQKGMSSKSCILPVGGKVLTAEEDYNILSDKHFPDPNASNEKENAQAFVVLPKEYPVFLWQPFLRHSYFCFPDPESQKQFSTALNDCIRHLNQDFFKEASFEAEAFLEAVQFFRQEKGHYGSWAMITGNEVQILSNLVMEELLPSLQSMLLPKMKGKKNDRKRAWFGILEDTYRLVQEQVSEGLSALKDECKEVTKGLEGTIRSDLDQILNSKNFLAGKINGNVSEPAQKCYGESVQPFLASILEELMGPVSSGFSEVRLLFEKEVNEISQSIQATNDAMKINEKLEKLVSLPYNSVKMEPCYLKVNLLQEQLQDLKSRFKFYDIDLVIQRTQNIMQELMENAVYTFEQLLRLSIPCDLAKMATAIEKVKLRVLKQYDYDSSTVRKKIFQDALVQITLPTLQRTLAATCKPELQKYEQFIFADHTSVIQVENVYEEILLQMLLDEIQKVIKEAAHLKKHNLFEEMHLPSISVSSLSDLKTPSGSAQASPARKAATKLTDVSYTDTQSNDVFTPEKIPQEECHETVDNEKEISAMASSIPTDTKEEIILDFSSRLESPSVILGSVEENIARRVPDVTETKVGGDTSENKVLVGEENLSVPDSVSEIRNLLTLTVELPVNVPPENKEVVHECGISNPQECSEEKDEDKMKAEICQTCEMQEPPRILSPESIEADDVKVTSISLPLNEESDYINVASISFPSNIEADYINVSSISVPSSADEDYINASSISGEQSCISQVEKCTSSEVPKEPGLCEASGTELETTASIWYADVEGSSPDDQFQTKQYAESGQSDQREVGLSPLPSVSVEGKSQTEQHDDGRQPNLREVDVSSLHFVAVDEKPQVEQHAENEKSDQKNEEFSSLHSVPMDDSSQTGQYIEGGESDLQETELSPLHSSTEVDAQLSFGCSLETEESVLNIGNLTIEPMDLPVSPEVKQSKDSNLEALVNIKSNGFTLVEVEDSKGTDVSLLHADVANALEAETGTLENAEGDCSKSQSEK